MNAALSTLEIRQVPPLEIPMVEVVLALPRAWFDEIKAHEVNVSRAVSCIVSEGGEYISGPLPRNDFPAVWERSVKAFSRKIPQRGETVRVLITMRFGELECFQKAARSVGISETELALAIIARRLSLIGQERGIRSGENQAPPVAIPKPSSLETVTENIIPFHRCHHCPHRWKPWGSPQNIS